MSHIKPESIGPGRSYSDILDLNFIFKIIIKKKILILKNHYWLGIIRIMTTTVRMELNGTPKSVKNTPKIFSKIFLKIF